MAKKRNINIDRPRVSSEVIRERMNFDELAKSVDANTPASSNKKKGFKKIGFGAVIVAAIVGVFYMNSGKNSTAELKTAESETDFTYAYSDNKSEFVQHKDNEIAEVFPLKVGENAFETENGSVFVVPEKSFELNGQPVSNENVTVYIDEFNHPFDIALSGISMLYDTLGAEHVFESAGMIKIRARIDTIPVDIMDGKRITCYLNSNDPRTEFNLYQYNESTQKWTCKGKDKVIRKGEELIDREELITVRKSIENIENEIVKLKKSKPIAPVSKSDFKHHFNVDVLPSQFPELEGMTSAEFGVDLKEKFSDEMYQVTWEDIKIDRKEEEYFMTLTSNQVRKKFKVHPILTGVYLKKGKEIFTKKFDIYQSKLKQKTAKKEKIEAEYLKMVAYSKKQEALQLKMMDEQEKLSSIQARHRLQLKKNKNEVFRTFDIGEMGVWNSDKGIKRPSNDFTYAYFNDDAGNRLEMKNGLFLIEEGTNACYPYEDGQKVGFNASKQNLLVGFTNDAKIFYTKDVQPSGADFTYQMSSYSGDVRNGEELKKAIGFGQ